MHVATAGVDDEADCAAGTKRGRQKIPEISIRRGTADRRDDDVPGFDEFAATCNIQLSPG